MYFAVICRDKPGALQTRLDNREAHLAYIEETGAVFMAGPFIENEQMVGSLVILEVESLKAAQDWAANDPYAKAGLFEDVQVKAWKKVIG
ncbi:hypothetical protein BMG03_02065 [Thioclava nitratireducens]|uniref:YCII-related domain-containing protein n=1 Tax=Thioclava nitratireducens TaxID=1915078 RepID=A0ABN4X6J1_9RHOB|nr:MULTISPECIES: YciI family protein [Thioclava]AQS46725.1 hypothetical protein BMG03_02065 [Thioclava nitratireducens]OWY02774.1 hypothetical protein B6V75_12950 [Thioclava sp. F1Mire-8]